MKKNRLNNGCRKTAIATTVALLFSGALPAAPTVTSPAGRRHRRAIPP
jgi:hypothetical protein